MTPDVIHVLEFLLGGALYYFVVSPRFRAYLKRVFRSWKGQHDLEEMPERALPLSPRSRVESRGGTLVVDERTVAEWRQNLKRNEP